MITIVGCNKGGAGKSTTSINIAVGLAMQGFDVVLVDADRQRSASKWCAEREEAAHQPQVTLVEKVDNISQTLKKQKKIGLEAWCFPCASSPKNAKRLLITHF